MSNFSIRNRGLYYTPNLLDMLAAPAPEVIVFKTKLVTENLPKQLKKTIDIILAKLKRKKIGLERATAELNKAKIKLITSGRLTAEEIVSTMAVRIGRCRSIAGRALNEMLTPNISAYKIEEAEATQGSMCFKPKTQVSIIIDGVALATTPTVMRLGKNRRRTYISVQSYKDNIDKVMEKFATVELESSSDFIGDPTLAGNVEIVSQALHTREGVVRDRGAAVTLETHEVAFQENAPEGSKTRSRTSSESSPSVSSGVGSSEYSGISYAESDTYINMTLVRRPSVSRSITRAPTYAKLACIVRETRLKEVQQEESSLEQASISMASVTIPSVTERSRGASCL